MAIEIDTRGKLCPLPLIMFKQGIKEHPEESQFVVITDNPTSCGNLKDFIQDHQFAYSEEQVKGSTYLRVTIDGNFVATEAPQEVHQPTMLQQGVTIQINSNHMGKGSDELGEVLILSFLNALLGADRLPKEIVCYNSGVLLAVRGTATAEKLLELEQKGVKVILCGTCVDYFGVKSELALGHITNMLSIYEHLSKAERIVQP